jgi:DNA-binding transcriptional MerR regulator
MSDGVTERAFLSIGEVLDLLKDEFPDVTISKIRFLESQGLIDPERTPSGYRKFYETDVARLRWILEQQRDHFLPLKVIKDKLAALPRDEVVPAPSGGAGTTSGPADREHLEHLEPVQAPRHVEQDPLPPRPGAGAGSLVAGLSAVSLTIGELATSSGLPVTAIQELERYGLLKGRTVAGHVYYDEEALVIASLAAHFARHGVEARHLRMYKTAAEREATFYEQVIAPFMKQRNPAARQQAVTTLEELTKLGESMRAAFVRASLRDYTDA